jgi:hypothetical protein
MVFGSDEGQVQLREKGPRMGATYAAPFMMEQPSGRRVLTVMSQPPR